MSITADGMESVPTTVDSNARKALLGSAIGYAMDGFDLLILGFMLRAIASDLHLSQAQAASLVTATLIGAVLGGIGFGMLSDRLGRVRILTWTIVVFAVFTGLCAFAQGYWDLLIYRTLAGVGLGGEFGIGMALVAEAWPASKRARASSYVGLGWQCGVLLAAIATPLLLPVIGWRGMFALGVFPAVAAYFIRASLHEPEVFVAKSKDHPKEVGAASSGKGHRDHQAQPWHGHPLLGAEFRLLRRDDLAAELPFDPVRFCADAVGDMDLRDARRHGAWHFHVRPYRRSHRPAAGVLQLHVRRRRHGAGLFAADRSLSSCSLSARSWASSSTACSAAMGR